METAEAELRVVEAVRALLEEDGLRGLRSPRIAERAGLDLPTLYRIAPTPVAALRRVLRHIDGLVLAGGPGEAEDPPRDRLFDVMMRRYDALVPWKAALRRMARTLPPDPLLAFGLALALERSMAAMLEAADISSVGLAGALRVRGLCLVHADALRAFLDDDSEDLSATMKVLDGRLRQAERLAPLLERLDPSPRTATTVGAAPMHQNRAEFSVSQSSNIN